MIKKIFMINRNNIYCIKVTILYWLLTFYRYLIFHLFINASSTWIFPLYISKYDPAKTVLTIAKPRKFFLLYFKESLINKNLDTPVLCRKNRF